MLYQNVEFSYQNVGEFFTEGRELGNYKVNYWDFKGIKLLSGYTTAIRLLSGSDLKRAFKYLAGVEMNLTIWRLMIILVLSFMGFLRFSKLSDLKRNDFILHYTRMLIFIENSTKDIYREGHWLYLVKLNSNLRPLDFTKRYFV